MGTIFPSCADAVENTVAVTVNVRYIETLGTGDEIWKMTAPELEEPLYFKKFPSNWRNPFTYQGKGILGSVYRPI